MRKFLNILRREGGHRKFISRRFNNEASMNSTQLDLLRALRLQRRIFHCTLGSIILVGGLNAYLFWDELSDYITPKVTEPIINVSQDILSNKELQISTQEVAQKFVCELLMTEETLNTLTDLLCKLIRQDLVVEAAYELVLKVLKDPYIQAEFNKVVGYALTDEYNQELLYDLLKKVLENTELQQVARDTVLEVIEDHSLQEVSSNALWSVLKGAVTPKWGGSPAETLAVPEVHFNVPIARDRGTEDVKDEQQVQD